MKKRNLSGGITTGWFARSLAAKQVVGVQQLITYLAPLPSVAFTNGMYRLSFRRPHDAG